MVVFATPVYYYGMTAQLKAVVDRFCSENAHITAKRLKAALLAVAWNDDAETFAPLEERTTMPSVATSTCATAAV